MSRIQRLHQVVLIAALGCISWLGMTLFHELGHILGAKVTGGTVQRIVWHPLVMPRTDVHPNPHPLVVVWGGPVIGVGLPAIIAGVMTVARLSMAYLAHFFAGFCLLANGSYLGFGIIGRVGDAGELLRHGTPVWVMIGRGRWSISGRSSHCHTRSG